MAATFLDVFGPPDSNASARRRGDQTWAKTLSLAGGVIAFADGCLGGHLSHVRAVAVGEHV